MTTYTFNEGDYAIAHSFGEDTPGEFRCIIRGVSASYEPYGHIWIVEWIDRPIYIGPYPVEGLEDKKYSCSTVPEVCLRLITFPKPKYRLEDEL